jgi:pimeloyl-ACP methyl ester carboxylesterase
MLALGHDEYAVLGHDIGMWIGYALAADFPESITSLAVTKATIPGLSPEPPFFAPSEASGRLFHFSFNRLDGLNYQLVEGREEIFFGHQFASKAAPQNAIDPEAIAEYIRPMKDDPAALRATFAPYRTST